jgi:SRSO17 transposase
MTRQQLRRLDRELAKFLSKLLEGQGRPERRAALGHYVTGLLLDGERKSIQPMAARLTQDASQADAMRQRLQDCIAASQWSEQELLRRFAVMLDDELPGIEVIVVDDTGFEKKGTFSVGVARQYSGTFGAIANGQVATSVHLAGDLGSVMVGMRLYLPKEWTDDRARCRAAGVPDDVPFKTKWEIALDLIDQMLAFGIRKRPVIADAGYGEITRFRDELTRRGLRYVVGIPHNRLIWPPGTELLPPADRTGLRGRRATRWHAGDIKPIQIGALVAGIPREKYKTVTWRQGVRGKLSSKFLAYRVRSAENQNHGRAHGEEQWLLCEWQACDDEPRFHLSTLPANTSLKELVRVTKQRWRVERDYQDLKGEVGLDHFEGRTWRGFHRHATLCAVAHGFIALRRALSPPVQQDLDDSAGPASPSAGPLAPHRVVPLVHTSHQRVRSGEARPSTSR